MKPFVSAVGGRCLGALVLGGLLLVASGVGANAAGWLERLFQGKNSTDVANALLSDEQVTAGLKAALGKGVEQAVSALGRTDGFLKDAKVKIPLPDALKKVESSLRFLRQDKLADEFVTTMNRAAERAVPEAAAVLGQSVQQLTLDDARAILSGTNNAATMFFRRTSETNLYTRFLPLVSKATAEAGVTSTYKQWLGKAGPAASLLGSDAGDLDAYVTHKALDGLFVKIADEEKRIRENPAARTTELLQQVFGTKK